MFGHGGIMATMRGFLLRFKPQPPLISEADRVMRAWARPVKSRDELPEAFRGAFETLLGDVAAFPYTIFVPSSQSFDNGANGKLICRLGDDIHILEESKGELTAIRYPVEHISCVEMGIVLLYAWISIRGLTSHGDPALSELRFNTVNDYLFTPFVKEIRSASLTPERVDLGPEWRKFDAIGPQNLKLMNFARRSLAPDERVVWHVFQPEIRISVLRSLGRSFLKTHFAAHVTILTNRELILIQDGAAKRFGSGVRHGGIWDYIPLHKVAAISLADAQDNLLTLSIVLAGNDRIERTFTASLRPELDALVHHFETTVSGLP